MRGWRDRPACWAPAARRRPGAAAFSAERFASVPLAPTDVVGETLADAEIGERTEHEQRRQREAEGTRARRAENARNDDTQERARDYGDPYIQYMRRHVGTKRSRRHSDARLRLCPTSDCAR